MANVRARYKGQVVNGEPQEFYPGVPARDLSDEDYEALDKDQRNAIRVGKLYETADARPKAEEAPPPPKREGG